MWNHNRKGEFARRMKQPKKLTRNLKERLSSKKKNPADWRIKEELPDKYVLINIKTKKEIEYSR